MKLAFTGRKSKIVVVLGEGPFSASSCFSSRVKDKDERISVCPANFLASEAHRAGRANVKTPTKEALSLLFGLHSFGVVEIISHHVLLMCIGRCLSSYRGAALSLICI